MIDPDRNLIKLRSGSMSVAYGTRMGCVRNSDGLRSVHHDLSSALMLHLFNFSVVKQAL